MGKSYRSNDFRSQKWLGKRNKKFQKKHDPHKPFKHNTLLSNPEETTNEKFNDPYDDQETQ